MPRPSCLPAVLELNNDWATIVMGDQESPEFWSKFVVDQGLANGIDIFNDDGGHGMKQQINTFKSMFPHVKSDGVYLCEDLATSYMSDYGGRPKDPRTTQGPEGSFVDFTKKARGARRQCVGGEHRFLLRLFWFVVCHSDASDFCAAF
jgi:hypothetical protein